MFRAPWRLCLAVAVAGCTRAAAAPVPATDDRLALRHVIDSMLAAPETRSARWGVLIVDPDAADTLYSHDAGKLMVPASNQKILTAAFALDAFGPDYRFETPVLAGGPVRDGIVEGNLLVAGRGDPSVSDHMAGDAMIPLHMIADSLIARGIRRIRGSIIAHGNAFPDANIGWAWEHDDLATTSGAAVDELLFNEGFSRITVFGGATPGDTARAVRAPAATFPALRLLAVTTARGTGRDSLPQVNAVKDTVRGDVVVTGTIPVGDSANLIVTHRDPSQAYIAALDEALRERGVAIDDSVFPSAASGDTVFVLRSPPLSQILAAFLKPSQNQIGEMLLKSVALVHADTGTARTGRRLISERLRAWGASPDGFLVWDGSGLSRQDLVSPETLIRVLDVMRRGPYFQTYYDAFPVAGVDGTLRTRMRSTAGEANVRGKTGTLSNVRSLSGYVTTADGRVLLYSVLANNYLVPTAYISRVQDTIAVRLARLRHTRGAH